VNRICEDVDTNYNESIQLCNINYFVKGSSEAGLIGSVLRLESIVVAVLMVEYDSSGFQ
jgi:hypothetical protein